MCDRGEQRATFSGTNAVRPKGSHFPPYHPCVRAREVMVRALACVGVHLCVFHGACMRERAPLFPSCSTRDAPPFVLNTSSSFSCPRHTPLLPSSSTSAAKRLLPSSSRKAPLQTLVLTMHRSFPHARHAFHFARCSSSVSPSLRSKPCAGDISRARACDSRNGGDVR